MAVAPPSNWPTVIVPALGSEDDVRHGLEALRSVGAAKVVVLEDVKAIDRRVRASTEPSVLFVLPPALVSADLPERYLAALESNPAAVVAYGDYEIVRDGTPPVRQTVLVDPFDLSEWSSWGYVWAVRREAWTIAGGYDASYRLVPDYELRLRLGMDRDFVRVTEPLYRIHCPLAAETASALRRYFTPESSSVPGYGYLFHPADITTEVERAFVSTLRGHGALLEHENLTVSCPHDNSRPRVTVLIPTHDRAPLVQRAIESVLRGEFEDFEILVVDNGSRDDTIEIVERIASRDPRVRLLENRRHATTASALNQGLRAARGKYVSQLDSDDEYFPRTLVEQVDALESHPDWGLAISYYEVVDPCGRLRPEVGVVRHLEFDRNQILRTSGAGAVRTWHRCVLERLDGFDEETFGSYAEDYDLILRVSEHYEIGRVHQVLYRVHEHGENTADRFDPETRARRKIEARRRALRRRRELNARRARDDAE